MMVTILLSIGSFTVASNPPQTWYSDVWVNHSDHQLLSGSNVSSYDDTVAYRSDSPSLLCLPLNEDRSPFWEIETFCIMVFTLEYVLRLVSSPAGPGVVAYFFNLANMIDLISIMPWYVQAATKGSNIDVLSVLRLIRLTRISRIFKMSKSFQVRSLASLEMRC